MGAVNAWARHHAAACWAFMQLVPHNRSIALMQVRRHPGLTSPESGAPAHTTPLQHKAFCTWMACAKSSAPEVHALDPCRTRRLGAHLGNRVACRLQDVISAAGLELLDGDRLRVKCQDAPGLHHAVLAVLELGLHGRQHLQSDNCMTLEFLKPPAAASTWRPSHSCMSGVTAAFPVNTAGALHALTLAS